MITLKSYITYHKHQIPTDRVKSGNFGYQVNSDIHLQTLKIHMRRLSQAFHCLLSSFLPITNNVAIRIYMMSEVSIQFNSILFGN